MPRVLIVEDDDATRKGLAINFKDDGYEVVTLARGDAVLDSVLAEPPDLIILDVMLPELSGFDVCRQLRHKGLDTPVILLTAKVEEIDRVVGLEIGADDYVVKPFSIRELLARARVQLRHRAKQGEPPPERYRFGEIEVDFAGFQVTRRQRPVELTPREFDVLRFMIRHRGQVLTRERMLREIWGYHKSTSTRTLDTHMLRLRQKLEGDPARPKHIISIYGVGYKFIE